MCSSLDITIRLFCTMERRVALLSLWLTLGGGSLGYTLLSQEVVICCPLLHFMSPLLQFQSQLLQFTFLQFCFPFCPLLQFPKYCVWGVNV